MQVFWGGHYDEMAKLQPHGFYKGLRHSTIAITQSIARFNLEYSSEGWIFRSINIRPHDESWDDRRMCW